MKLKDINSQRYSIICRNHQKYTKEDLFNSKFECIIEASRVWNQAVSKPSKKVTKADIISRINEASSTSSGYNIGYWNSFNKHDIITKKEYIEHVVNKLKGKRTYLLQNIRGYGICGFDAYHKPKWPENQYFSGKEIIDLDIIKSLDDLNSINYSIIDRIVSKDYVCGLPCEKTHEMVSYNYCTHDCPNAFLFSKDDVMSAYDGINGLISYNNFVRKTGVGEQISKDELMSLLADDKKLFKIHVTMWNESVMDELQMIL